MAVRKTDIVVHVKRDYRLVDRDCVVLDGKCDCKRNPDGGIPLGCKYLEKK